MRRFGGLGHLARRFVGSLRPRHPGPLEQRLVGTSLSEAEARLFWSQAPADIDHAIVVASAIPQGRADTRRLVAAALLHDVGKAVVGIGPLRRSVATVLAVLRAPRTPRMQAYLDHGRIGAERLRQAGADPLTVAFAAHHHEELPPPGVESDHWAILRAADQGR